MTSVYHLRNTTERLPLYSCCSLLLLIFWQLEQVQEALKKTAEGAAKSLSEASEVIKVATNESKQVRLPFHRDLRHSCLQMRPGFNAELHAHEAW